MGAIMGAIYFGILWELLGFSEKQWSKMGKKANHTIYNLQRA
jgi:hypothetical protein